MDEAGRSSPLRESETFRKWNFGSQRKVLKFCEWNVWKWVMELGRESRIGMVKEHCV